MTGKESEQTDPRNPPSLPMGMPTIAHILQGLRFFPELSSSPVFEQDLAGEFPTSVAEQDSPSGPISFPLMGVGSLKEPSGKSLCKAKEPFPARNFSLLGVRVSGEGG